MTPFSDIEAAYIAGVIDSDGCIHFERARRKNGGFRYRIIVAVDMCDLPTMEHISKTTGGRLVTKRSLRGSLTKRPFIYRLTWRNGPAEDFLRRILPFLHNKKRQAELGIEFQNQVAKPLGVKFTADDFTICERFYLEMKALNNPSDLRC